MVLSPQVRDEIGKIMSEGDGGPAVQLYVGVFAPHEPDVERLIGLMRSATEKVLLPALTVSDHTMQLQVVRRGEDLSRERRPRGVVWDEVRRAEPLEDVMVTATRPWSSGVPVQPSLVVHARPPGPWRRLDGTIGQTATAVDFSVRLSEIGGAVQPELTGRAVTWIERAVREIGAVTGYMTVDRLLAGPGAMSPYETAVMAPPAARDPTREIVGYGWGTLLGPEHVDRLGGRDAIDAAPVHRRAQFDDGRWWLELHGDPSAVSRASIADLRRFLAPVLREGSRRFEDAEDLGFLL